MSTRAEVVKLRLQGCKVLDICNLIQRSEPTVRYHLKKAGLTDQRFRPNQYKDKYPTREAIVLARKGHTFEEAANILGVSSRFLIKLSGKYKIYWDEVESFKEPSVEEILELRKSLTIREIANKLGLRKYYLEKFLQERDLSHHLCKYGYSISDNTVLNDEQMECFVGNMLGDGSIHRCGEIERGYCNGWFSLQQKLKNKEYVLFLQELYRPFSSDYKEKIARRPKRVNGKINHSLEHWDGTYLHSCNFITCSCKFFTEQRIRWYERPSLIKSRKIVPQDIRLTWLTVAIWVCDDGHNRPKNRSFILHTNSFSEEDVRYLIERLWLDLGIVANLHFHSGNPIIYIPAGSYDRFKDGIRPYIFWDCFSYKVK